MPSEIDIANQALSMLGTRSTIASLTEDSNEARAIATWIEQVRDEVSRAAPWNCVKNFNNLALVCAAPGTPENPTQGANQWTKGTPPPPWAYEYRYPADCLRPLYIIPQFMTGFASGVPITTAVTGGQLSFWNGPPVRFLVTLDQLDPSSGLPSATGTDAKVILTNQENAILAYNKRVTDPNVMDSQFTAAWAAALAGRLVFQLMGDKALANMKLQEANSLIMAARATDGNEGLTINNVTPDWIRFRGLDYPTDQSWTPNIQFDWGNTLTMY
jgi:hypothetical protein